MRIIMLFTPVLNISACAGEIMNRALELNLSANPCPWSALCIKLSFCPLPVSFSTESFINVITTYGSGCIWLFRENVSSSRNADFDLASISMLMDVLLSSRNLTCACAPTVQQATNAKRIILRCISLIILYAAKIRIIPQNSKGIIPKME